VAIQEVVAPNHQRLLTPEPGFRHEQMIHDNNHSQRTKGGCHVGRAAMAYHARVPVQPVGRIEPFLVQVQPATINITLVMRWTLTPTQTVRPIAATRTPALAPGRSPVFPALEMLLSCADWWQDGFIACYWANSSNTCSLCVPCYLQRSRFQ